MQNTCASFKIALLGHAEESGKEVSLVPSKDLLDFPLGPDIELPFLSLTVGIFRRVERALRGSHVSQDIGKDLLGHRGVPLFSRGLVGFKIGNGQHGLVIEHLLEVGNQPAGVRGIAVKPETHVIIDASARHGVQGRFHHGQGLLVPASLPPAKKKGEVMGHGELGGSAEPAVSPVVSFLEGLKGLSQILNGQHTAG